MFLNSLKNKRTLYYHLWSTIKAGLIISEALLICPGTAYQKKCSVWANAIKTGGSTFSEILQQDKSFNTYDCYIIEMAEKTGNYVEVFENLYQYYDHKIKTQNKFISKITYPCFLIIMMGVFYNVILLFSNFSISKMLINLFWFYLPFVLIIIFFAFVLPKLISIDNSFGRIAESIMFRTPFLGKYLLSGTTSRFMFPLEMVFRSGISITNGFELVLKTTKSPNFRFDLQKIISRSRQGLSCQELLKELKWLDPTSYAMIATAEVSGQIPENLHRIYEQKVEENQVATFVLVTIVTSVFLLTVLLVCAYLIIGMYSGLLSQIPGLK